MNPINGALGGRGDPVDQNCGVPLHQEQREARDVVAAAFALISPSLPRQGLGNLFHLSKVEIGLVQMTPQTKWG